MRPDALPAPLQARLCRRLQPLDPSRSGPIIYWMRVAARAHDNPALDVALAVAEALDRDVLVYHGLDERYPYASDRHHRFILEGARDVARDLKARGVPYAFHLRRPGHRQPALAQLAAEAPLVVTEEMPIPPLSTLTEALAQRAPVWTVDATCLVPMGALPRSYERAFQFQNATEQPRRAALTDGWRDRPLHRPMSGPERLPFEPLDLTNADLDALIACCDIDHGVAPVQHTVGGRDAGEARWRAFTRGPLRRYANTRNDATRPGTSRLSPYLHYGHVSPFQLAREAAALGTPSAERWLDQLLIWREMAWHWCHHNPLHDLFSALPAWAQDTLHQHTRDPRPRHAEWSTLAHAQTGDLLWDAAQRSLLIHGELHNNVRMTWGKAFLQWTGSPERALDLMVDLNHRYALDGRDPVSVCSLLWCLGFFDRPFDPPRPIFGRIRPRSSAAHAARTDTSQYISATRRSVRQPTPNVAIVGAGVAGLSCAQTLTAHGWRVQLFDKGRGPGGRLSTRRAEDLRFDHGAIAFTAQSSIFQRYVDAWSAQGHVARWPKLEAQLNLAPLYTGSPAMNALIKHLAADQAVQFGARVTATHAVDSGWQLELDGSRHQETFDGLVLAIPAPQAVPLLDHTPTLANIAASAEMRPCWSVLLAFEGVSGALCEPLQLDGSPLLRLIPEPSKPGRSAVEAWVLQATPEWSEAHLERDPAWIATTLSTLAFKRWGIVSPSLTHLRAHRWRYAFPRQPLSAESLLHDADRLIGLCGDWCGPPTSTIYGLIESAWRSGRDLAGRLLATKSPNAAVPYLLGTESQPSLFE